MSKLLAWLSIARRPLVVKRSMKVALVVGTLLTLINQGSVLLAGQLSLDALLKILLTYCVPYIVSTYAAVGAIQEG